MSLTYLKDAWSKAVTIDNDLPENVEDDEEGGGGGEEEEEDCEHHSAQEQVLHRHIGTVHSEKEFTLDI